MPTLLFISDLHLESGRPEINGIFTRFLSQSCQPGDNLYILGDLFEAWIGDDDTSAFASAIIRDLSNCSTRGIDISIMHGNRDFLLGDDFAARSGCKLIEDPCVLDIDGIPTVLTHGDQLCTDDTGYQEFRRVVRSPAWQQQFLGRPLHERARLAAEMRDASDQSTTEKPAEIMDVNPDAVQALIRKTRAGRIIHGHTHRPATHEETVDGKTVPRFVLAAWHKQGSALRIEGSAISHLEIS